jgi:hypothetical protein
LRQWSSAAYHRSQIRSAVVTASSPASGCLAKPYAAARSPREEGKPSFNPVCQGAASNGQDVSVQAKTAFRFADFGLSIPRMASVLSVEDSIRLEIDLLLQRNSCALPCGRQGSKPRLIVGAGGIQ